MKDTLYDKPVKLKEWEVVIWSDNFQTCHRFPYDTVFDPPKNLFALYANYYFVYSEYCGNPEKFQEKYPGITIQQIRDNIDKIDELIQYDFVMCAPSWKVDILAPKVRANPENYRQIIDDLTPNGKYPKEEELDKSSFGCGVRYDDETGEFIFHAVSGVVPENLKAIFEKNKDELKKMCLDARDKRKN